MLLLKIVYGCRVRIGAAPLERTICPNRMGALEKSIRGYAENPNETVIKPELGTSFDSIGEVHPYFHVVALKDVPRLIFRL